MSYRVLTRRTPQPGQPLIEVLIFGPSSITANTVVPFLWRANFGNDHVFENVVDAQVDIFSDTGNIMNVRPCKVEINSGLTFQVGTGIPQTPARIGLTYTPKRYLLKCEQPSLHWVKYEIRNKNQSYVIGGEIDVVFPQATRKTRNFLIVDVHSWFKKPRSWFIGGNKKLFRYVRHTFR